MEQSVEALSTIPTRMYEAWNRGDVAGFFADFAEDVLFAELEGTIYRSRAAAIAAHEVLLDTAMKGSKLVQGEVHFARIVSPGVGVVHSRVGILLPGEDGPPSTPLLHAALRHGLARRPLGGRRPGERAPALPGDHGGPRVPGGVSGSTLIRGSSAGG